VFAKVDPKTGALAGPGAPAKVEIFVRETAPSEATRPTTNVSRFRQLDQPS
jgi:hypothetical protein